jgi:hypothetical protein
MVVAAPAEGVRVRRRFFDDAAGFSGERWLVETEVS